MKTSGQRVVVVGAGPAGLTAAYELSERGVSSIVLEKSDLVGGIARTEQYKGYRFDIGGHRFFTKAPEVEAIWRRVLGDDLIRVPRLSSIYFGGKRFSYPLRFMDVLAKLGVLYSASAFVSYVYSRLRPRKPERSFEDWVSNRFGMRLYQTFFKTYTEKVWGVPCAEISAEWAAQRIRGLSFAKAVWNAVFKGGGGGEKTLIEEFWYPALGPGMLWSRMTDLLSAAGNEIRMSSDVIRVNRDGHHIQNVEIAHGAGQSEAVHGDHYISSMPLSELVLKLDPPAPPDVVEAARSLVYRDFLTVILLLRKKDLFPDQWIYIHSPAVKVGRIQNFRNWSSRLVPDPTVTSLGMEYFCNEGDETWCMPDEELVALAKRELQAIDLGLESDVFDGVVVRQPKAYPVYMGEYRAHLQTLKNYIAGLDNLQTIGRNGLHRYNNQDHSMLTGIYAARNILGAAHDVWEVNEEDSYLEEGKAPPQEGEGPSR